MFSLFAFVTMIIESLAEVDISTNGEGIRWIFIYFGVLWCIAAITCLVLGGLEKE